MILQVKEKWSGKLFVSGHQRKKLTPQAAIVRSLSFAFID